MVILKNIKTLSLTLAAVVFVLFGISLNFNISTSDVEAISKACQNSVACREAVEKEQEANKNAKAATESANAYQARVIELSAEIASKEADAAACP